MMKQKKYYKYYLIMDIIGGEEVIQTYVNVLLILKH